MLQFSLTCSSKNGLDSKYWNGMWILYISKLITYLFVLILTTYIFWFEKIIFHIVSTHHWHKEQSIGTAYIAQQSLRRFTQPCNQIRSYILWAYIMVRVKYATICSLSWFHMILSDSDLLGASCNVCPDPVLTSNITSLAFLSASKCS